MFLMFASLNVGVMAPFSLIIPETNGRSLEEMDIVFGAVSANDRAANIARHEQEIANVGVHADLERAGSIDDKGDES